jgi:hypothetical protein
MTILFLSFRIKKGESVSGNYHRFSFSPPPPRGWKKWNRENLKELRDKRETKRNETNIDMGGKLKVNTVP